MAEAPKGGAVGDIESEINGYRWEDGSTSSGTSEDELMDFEEMMDSDNESDSAKIAPANSDFGSTNSITDIMRTANLSDSSLAGSTSSLVDIKTDSEGNGGYKSLGSVKFEPSDFPASSVDFEPRSFTPIRIKTEPVDNASDTGSDSGFSSFMGSTAGSSSDTAAATAVKEEFQLPPPEGDFVNHMMHMRGMGPRFHEARGWGPPFRGHRRFHHHHHHPHPEAQGSSSTGPVSSQGHESEGEGHSEGHGHHGEGHHHSHHHHHHHGHHHGHHPHRAERFDRKVWKEMRHCGRPYPGFGAGRGGPDGACHGGIWRQMMRGMIGRGGWRGGGRGRGLHHPLWADGHDWFSKTLKCPICEKELEKYKRSLRNHFRAEHADKLGELFPYKCEKCDESFMFEKKFMKHMIKKHKEDTDLNCPFCPIILPKKRRLIQEHLFTHEEVVLKCEDCKLGFLFERGYQKHQLRDKWWAKKENFTCDICGAEFKRRYNLYAHMSVHSEERQFSCHLCQQTFKHKESLRNHLRIHLGLRNHKCDLCDASFYRATELKDHMATHSDVREFECDKCDKKFKKQNQLNKHMRVHTRVKNFVCDACGDSFAQSGHLITHKRKHTDVRPFSCPADGCYQSFTTSSSLIRHVARQHDGVQPFKCDTCGQGFDHLRPLKQHEIKVHSEKKIEDIRKTLDSTIEAKKEAGVAESDSDDESQLQIDMTSYDDLTGLLHVDSSKDILNSLLEEIPHK